MKLNYSKKIFILVIIFFVLTITLTIIFSNLLVGKIVGINDKVKQLMISSAERERDLNLRDSIASSVAERQKLDQYFVGSGNGETADFISYFEALAKTSGVIQTIGFVGYENSGELGASDTANLLRLRVNFSGRWENVYRFLQTVENLPRVVVVNSVSLNDSFDLGSTKGERIWSADLDFSVGKLKN
jgi:hypothetical protein